MCALSGGAMKCGLGSTLASVMFIWDIRVAIAWSTGVLGFSIAVQRQHVNSYK